MFVPLGDVLERRALMMRMYGAVSVALVLVAMVIASSHFTYKYVEDPARRLFNRLSGAR